MTRGRWAGAAVVGVVIAALLTLIGHDVAHGVLGGLLWLIGVVLAVHLGIGQRVALPRLPFDSRDGARTEVSSLSWSLYGPDGISYEAQRRLRQVCRTGLADAGIDLATRTGQERASAVLGSPVTAWVLDPAAPPPDARTLRATLLTLEKLEESR